MKTVIDASSPQHTEDPRTKDDDTSQPTRSVVVRSILVLLAIGLSLVLFCPFEAGAQSLDLSAMLISSAFLLVPVLAYPLNK